MKTTTTTIIIFALRHCKIRLKIMTSKYELRITSTYSNIFFFQELRFSESDLSAETMPISHVREM